MTTLRFFLRGGSRRLMDGLHNETASAVVSGRITKTMPLNHLLWNATRILLPDSNYSDDDGTMNDRNATDPNEQQPVESGRDVWVYVLACIAAFIASLFVSYAFFVVMDHYCCCFPWFRPVGSNGTSYDEGDHGPVARKAGLWGLRRSERRRVLTRVFESAVSTWGDENNDDEKVVEEEARLEQEKEGEPPPDDKKESESLTQHGDETPLDQTVGTLEPSSMAANVKAAAVVVNDVEQGLVIQSAWSSDDDNKCIHKSQGETVTDKNKRQDEEDPQSNSDGKRLHHQSNTSSASAATASKSNSNSDRLYDLDDGDHNRVCCICLAEYEPGDKVLTGTSGYCYHKFHYHCCMEWLTGQHNGHDNGGNMNGPQVIVANRDHCPYCRRELFTARQMRDAAKQELGEERVTELGLWHYGQQPGQRNGVSNSSSNNNIAAAVSSPGTPETTAAVGTNAAGDAVHSS